jgi:hypothetical protein
LSQVCRRFVPVASKKTGTNQGQISQKTAKKPWNKAGFVPRKVIKPEYPADQLMADYPQKKYCLA